MSRNKFETNLNEQKEPIRNKRNVPLKIIQIIQNDLIKQFLNKINLQL